MSETAPVTAQAPAAQSTAQAAADQPQEWKPEPRQWGWKDLFTAPMLAFKPKCMLVSALTLVALALLTKGLIEVQIKAQLDAPWVHLVTVGFALVGLAVFGLGATLVGTFLKADLLDDEFLSIGEALGQFKSRILPAMIVPLFLVALLAGVFLCLIYIPMLVGSIPYGGGFVYAILYPLGWFAAVFFVLLACAIGLSLYVFPAIVSVRRHGWFDNVVDTIEAVGTKPHVLFACFILSVLLVLFASFVGVKGWTLLKDLSGASSYAGNGWMPGTELKQVEQSATALVGSAAGWLAVGPFQTLLPFDVHTTMSAGSIYNREGIYGYGSGMIAGIWQVGILALLAGYCLNLMLAGGMLSYLVVREDDYWDDEDLEDLDKLAKELEEEAKRETSGQAPVAAAAPSPATAPTPVTAPNPAAEPPKA